MSDGEGTPSPEPASGGAAPSTQPREHATHPPRAGHQASHLPKVAVPRRLRRLAAAGRQGVCHLQAGWPAVPPPLLRDEPPAAQPRPCGNATAAPRHRPAPPPAVRGGAAPPHGRSSAAQWSCRGPCTTPGLRARSSRRGVAEVPLVRRWRWPWLAEGGARCAVGLTPAPRPPAALPCPVPEPGCPPPRHRSPPGASPRPPAPPSPATAPGGGHPERPLPHLGPQLSPGAALGRRGSPRVAVPRAGSFLRGAAPSPRVPPAAGLAVLVPGPTRPLITAATALGCVWARGHGSGAVSPRPLRAP